MTKMIQDKENAKDKTVADAMKEQLNYKKSKFAEEKMANNKLIPKKGALDIN